jgi:hypothetical protein
MCDSLVVKHSLSVVITLISTIKKPVRAMSPPRGFAPLSVLPAEPQATAPTCGLCQWKIKGAALAPWRWIPHPHELMHLEISRCPLSSSASFDFVRSSLRCPYRLDPQSDCTRDPHRTLISALFCACCGPPRC